MKRGPRPNMVPTVAVLGLVLVSCQGGLGPFPDVTEIDASGLKALQAREPAPLLVAPRTAEEYARGHLPGAISVDLEVFDAWLLNGGAPTDRPVVTICRRGNQSRIAAVRASRRGIAAVSLAGGMAGIPSSGLETGAGTPVAPALLQPPVVTPGLFEQVIVVLSGLVMKPTYMVLSLVLIMLLWRTRDRGLVYVRHGMVLFLFGEGACALNYIFSSGASDPLDTLHGLGMLGMGMFLPWGLALIADERIVRYENREATCAFQRFCGHCWKREPVPCGMHRLFLFAAPARAIVALIPLTSPLFPSKPVVQVFDSQVVYAVSLPVQLAMFRLYPLVAASLLTIALAILLVRGIPGIRWAQPFFFAGVGVALFALFKFFLFEVFRTAPWWADFWEEATELLSMVGVLVFLWIFRRQLEVFGFLDRLLDRFRKRAESAPSA